MLFPMQVSSTYQVIHFGLQTHFVDVDIIGVQLMAHQHGHLMIHGQ
jgi:hypothetical protein